MMGDNTENTTPEITIVGPSLPDDVRRWLEMLLQPEVLFGADLMGDARLLTLLTVVQQLGSHALQILSDGSVRMIRIKTTPIVIGDADVSVDWPTEIEEKGGVFW